LYFSNYYANAKLGVKSVVTIEKTLETCRKSKCAKNLKTWKNRPEPISFLLLKQTFLIKPPVLTPVEIQERNSAFKLW